MNKNKIKEYIENQFIEDYEEIYKFMIDINESLENMKFDKYLSYNEFCLDVENSIMESFNNYNEILTTKLIVESLNNMIKYKIMKDENYENKIRNYFDKDENENIINDINNLKLKIINNNIKSL